VEIKEKGRNKGKIMREKWFGKKLKDHISKELLLKNWLYLQKSAP